MKKLKPKRTNLKNLIILRKRKNENIIFEEEYNFSKHYERFKKLQTYSEEYQSKAIENHCGYIVHKAYSLLENPPLKENCTEEEIEDIDLLIEGCKQVVEYKGYTEEYPYTNIGIHGFYVLYNFLGFEMFTQEATSIEKEDGLYYMDKMSMKHDFYEDHNMVVYNLVKSEYEPD